eukprot:726949-Prorocentrum_minimum.AAC.3
MAIPPSVRRFRERAVGYKRQVILGVVLLSGVYVLFTSLICIQLPNVPVCVRLRKTSTVQLSVNSVERKASFGHKRILDEVKGISPVVDSQHRYISNMQRVVATVSALLTTFLISGVWLDTQTLAREYTLAHLCASWERSDMVAVQVCVLCICEMSASSLTCSNLQDDAHDIGHEEDQSRDHDHDHDDHQQDRHGDHDHREHRDHQDHREHQHLKRHPAISMSAIDSSEHDSHHHARSLNLAAHHVKVRT